MTPEEYARTKIDEKLTRSGWVIQDKDRLNLSASKEKQDEVVNMIESRMSVCDSIEQTVNAALSQAEALRQSILKEAFEGRLV